jgi:hypothetical protein
MTELKDLQLTAQAEIRQLRQAKQTLHAKVDTLDNLPNFL